MRPSPTKSHSRDTNFGEALGSTVRVSANFTLAPPRVGLTTQPGRARVGELYLGNIGVPPGVYERLGFSVDGLFAPGEVLSLEKEFRSMAMSPWDDRYALDGWAFGTEPNDFLRQEAHRIPPGRVLCLGEGEGRNSVFLAEQGYEVVGVDRSQVGMDKAQELAQERDVFVETVVSSIEDFDLTEGEWQGIISVFFHLPLELRKQVHQAVVKGLAPGGILILEAYTPRQLDFETGGPPHSERLMTLSDLEEELDGLDFLLAHETEREIHEGRMHTGKGSVVQIVGRRA